MQHDEFTKFHGLDMINVKDFCKLNEALSFR